MSYQFATANKIDKKAWMDFVYNHPEGTIFQTWEMVELYRKTKNNDPITAAVLDARTGEILGILTAVLIKNYSGFLGKLTTRSIIRGGPLVKDKNPEIPGQILSEYDKLVKKKAIYTQVRNLWDVDSTRGIFARAGFDYEEHLNLWVDLTKTEEQLWKEVHSKRRNEIRRAKREGTSVREINDLSRVKECIGILKEVYCGAGLPFPEDSLFENAFCLLSGKGYIKFFGAFNDNKLIGTMVVFTYKKVIYDWYAGSYKEYYHKYPNDLLPWEVFLWGKKNGFETFDFGGAGKPGIPYGVRDYKKKFGGTFYNFGRFEKIHKPFLYRAGKIGFYLYKRTR